MPNDILDFTQLKFTKHLCTEIYTKQLKSELNEELSIKISNNLAHINCQDNLLILTNDTIEILCKLL